MKLLLVLLATSALVLWVGLAQAQAKSGDFILSFEPPALPEPIPPPDPPVPLPVASEHRPLPIPAHGTRPPMRFHSPSQLPSGVYRRAVAVALNGGHESADGLPPAPPLLDPDPMPTATPAPAVPTVTESASPVLVADVARADDLVLQFDLPPTVPPPAPIAQGVPAAVPVTGPQPPLVAALFEGGSQSLVARTVGSAEGTRTATGDITPAYHGHTDPGNRAWNLGTFSYQHGATSAAEADRKQLARLQGQTEVLKQRAINRTMSLTLEETLNGIDLANQSPLAAIGRVGYIERLAEVKTWGLEGTEAIVVARTRSYINPNTGRWNAPGLGNTEASITRDQRRRTEAIARALEAYRLEHPDQDFSPTRITLAPPTVLATVAPSPPPVEEPTPDPLPVQFELPDEALTSATVATAEDLAPMSPPQDTATEAITTSETTPQSEANPPSIQPVAPTTEAATTEAIDGHTSVYQNLDALSEQGILECVDRADSQLYGPSSRSHSHVNCLDTDDIIDVDVVLPVEIIRQIEIQTGMAITDYRIDFFGKKAASV